MIPLLSLPAKRRTRRHAKAVAKALAAARVERPRADHFTRAALLKHGAPAGPAIRRIVLEHRLELMRQSVAIGAPLARAPFWAEGAVWP